jgi:hypothetical protein
LVQVSTTTKSSELPMLCMSGSFRRPFIADNGRTIFRWIVQRQPMGDNFPQVADHPVVEIDSNTTRQDGVNGTSTTGLSAVEEKIY